MDNLHGDLVYLMLLTRLLSSFSVEPYVDPSAKDKPTNLSVIAEDAVIFECPISGIPQPKITWYKEGVRLHPQNEINMRLLDKGRRLEISVSDTTDTGAYTCVGENAAGKQSIDFALDVLSKSL